MHTIRGHIRRHAESFIYAGKEVPFTYWAHTQAGEKPDTIIFLGTGQTGSIPRWTAQNTPPGAIIVEGAPHWHAHPSAHDLYDFMYAYTLAAFRAVGKAFSLTTTCIVAQSQAAPGVIRLGNEYPAEVGNIVLVAPLGFTTTAFGDTPNTRVHTLLKRALRTFLQPTQSPLHDPRNLYAGYAILRAILRESERGASRRKYAAGLSYAMLGEFQTLVKQQTKQGKTVTLLLGGEDKIFTVDEIQSALTSEGITDTQIHVLPNMSHLSLGTRAGKEPLRAAMQIVRQQAQKPQSNHARRPVRPKLHTTKSGTL